MNLSSEYAYGRYIFDISYDTNRSRFNSFMYIFEVLYLNSENNVWFLFNFFTRHLAVRRSISLLSSKTHICYRNLTPLNLHEIEYTFMNIKTNKLY